MKWLLTFIYIVVFRIRHKIHMTKQRIVKPKGEEMSMHKVAHIDTKGRFMLVRCSQCGETNLVLDKKEAKELYSKLTCIS